VVTLFFTKQKPRNQFPATRKGCRDVKLSRGYDTLYEVFGRLLVMEMEVFKLVVTMLVAERRDGER
jgi:hypothetical protein